MPEIFVDADACPVKEEVLRVAERHGVKLHLVSNTWMRGYDHPLVSKKVVAEGADAADDWIAETIGPGDIAVTSDIPLASRCIAKGARVLRPNGKAITEDSIGMVLATRNLMTDLRETGEITGGPSAFTNKDRSTFLGTLENTVQAVLRACR